MLCYRNGVSGPNSNGKGAFYILHIEDNPSDAELIAAALQAQFACHITVAATRAAFEAALLRGQPDVIVSDSSLPNLDGFAALALAGKSYPTVPFIFCSGNIPDLMKVEAAAHGATDFISKDRIEELGTLIKRLREA
jgi:CheY-like chemotaxis protein